MSQAQVARTPGAKRAGAGEYLFDLTKVNQIKGGPDYSTAAGACVEGERMIVGLMRMPAGTGAEPHSHPLPLVARAHTVQTGAQSSKKATPNLRGEP